MDASVVKAAPLGRLLALGLDLDSRLFQAAYRRRGSRPSAFLMWLMTKSGDGPGYVFLGVALTGMGAPCAHVWWKAAALAFLVERVLYITLKNVFKRARPYLTLPHVKNTINPLDRYSFPSGHAAGACVVATLTVYFYPLFTVPVLLWAGMVAYSRIYHGIHYPADVLAGMAVGHACAMFALGVIA